MIKLITGKRGSGKTKVLIDAIHEAEKKSNGNVVAIQKGSSLNTDITYKVRLVNIEDYNVEGYDAFYGFIAGILASNSDITDIFVDSSLKICGNDVSGFEAMLPKLDKLSGEVNIVMSASIAVEEAPEGIKKYA